MKTEGLIITILLPVIIFGWRLNSAQAQQECSLSELETQIATLIQQCNLEQNSILKDKIACNLAQKIKLLEKQAALELGDSSYTLADIYGTFRTTEGKQIYKIADQAFTEQDLIKWKNTHLPKSRTQELKMTGKLNEKEIEGIDTIESLFLPKIKEVSLSGLFSTQLPKLSEFIGSIKARVSTQFKSVKPDVKEKVQKTNQILDQIYDDLIKGVGQRFNQIKPIISAFTLSHVTEHLSYSLSHSNLKDPESFQKALELAKNLILGANRQSKELTGFFPKQFYPADFVANIVNEKKLFSENIFPKILEQIELNHDKIYSKQNLLKAIAQNGTFEVNIPLKIPGTSNQSIAVKLRMTLSNAQSKNSSILEIQQLYPICGPGVLVYNSKTHALSEVLCNNIKYF